MYIDNTIEAKRALSLHCAIIPGREHSCLPYCYVNIAKLDIYRITVAVTSGSVDSTIYKTNKFFNIDSCMLLISKVLKQRKYLFIALFTAISPARHH